MPMSKCQVLWPLIARDVQRALPLNKSWCPISIQFTEQRSSKPINRRSKLNPFPSFTRVPIVPTKPNGRAVLGFMWNCLTQTSPNLPKQLIDVSSTRLMETVIAGTQLGCWFRQILSSELKPHLVATFRIPQWWCLMNILSNKLTVCLLNLPILDFENQKRKFPVRIKCRIKWFSSLAQMKSILFLLDLLPQDSMSMRWC